MYVYSLWLTCPCLDNHTDARICVNLLGKLPIEIKSLFEPIAAALSQTVPHGGVLVRTGVRDVQPVVLAGALLLRSNAAAQRVRLATGGHHVDLWAPHNRETLPQMSFLLV